MEYYGQKEKFYCFCLHGVFVSKSKTGQKMFAAVPSFRLKIENETENVRRRSEFSSKSGAMKKFQNQKITVNL